VTTDTLFFLQELYTKSGHRAGLNAMLGIYDSRRELIAATRMNKRYIVPIPFAYGRSIKQVLAYTNLQRQGIKFTFTLARLESLLVVSHPNLNIFLSETGAVFGTRSIRVAIDQTFLETSEHERRKFKNAEYDRVVVYNDEKKYRICNGEISVPIEDAHPMDEMIFAVRRKCNELQNNHLNYSGIYGMEPIEHISFGLGTNMLYNMKYPQYFRQITPFMHHTNIPQYFIYCITFSVDPENPLQRSNTMHAAQVEKAHLDIKLQSGLEHEEVTLILLKRLVNVNRYQRHLMGPLFS